MPKFVKFVSHALLYALLAFVVIGLILQATTGAVIADRALDSLGALVLGGLGIAMVVAALLVLLIPRRYHITPKVKLVPVSE